MINTLKKLFKLSTNGRSAAKNNVVLQKLEEIASRETGKGSLSRDARMKVSMVVLPEVFQKYDDNYYAVDPKVAKAWAIGLGQVIGMIVGVAVRPDNLDKALEQIVAEAKDHARMVNSAHTALKRARGITGIHAESASTTQSVTTKAATTANLEHKKRIIEDLESQAILEQLPEAKEALNAMATRLRKEMELDNAA